MTFTSFHDEMGLVQFTTINMEYGVYGIHKAYHFFFFRSLKGQNSWVSKKGLGLKGVLITY